MAENTTTKACFAAMSIQAWMLLPSACTERSERAPSEVEGFKSPLSLSRNSTRW